MPVYQITAPDGKTYKINGPEGASQQDVINAVMAQHPMAGQTTAELESAKSAPFSFGDIAKSFGSGVVGGAKSLVDVVGAGSGVSQGLGEAQDYLQRSLSPERQAEIARDQELMNRAQDKGIGSEIMAGLKTVAHAPFQSIAQGVGSSLPMIVGGLATLPEAAAAASPALALGVQRATSLLIAAAQGVGETKGSIHDEVKKAYMDQGVPETEAAKLAVKAQEYTLEKAPMLIGSAAFGALDALTGFEKSTSRALKDAFKGEERKLEGKGLKAAIAALPEKAPELPTLAKSALHTAGEEGLTEALQGGYGQAAQNIGMSQAGFETPTMQGVGGAAAHDALIGALTGGAMSPLHFQGAKSDYAADQFLRQVKGQQEEDQKNANAIKEQQETRAKTEESLNVPKMLALPAPAKAAEEEKDPLQNPVGRVTEDELGKAIGNNTVVNYLNKYRRDNNLPKLKSYSIEDIKDAMTSQNPQGEEGALNAILAYKTNYQNETYTPEDIQNRAVAKNVATETKGFSDFLTRATGKSDLNTMTQPELHSVATALDALPRTGKEQQLVLPEGSNATRFTQDQYNQGVTQALMNVKEGKPVTLDQAREAIKAQTDLKTDRDADHLLKTAASNEDLIVEKGTGFQAVSPGGVVLGTYGTEAEAKRNHRRADILPVDTQLVRAPQEVNQEKVAQLPEGYEINKKTVAGESGPAAYVVREDGSQTNASQTFADEADAKDRLNILSRKREANAVAEEAAADRIRKDLENRQSKIAQMEADGQTDTAEHKNAVAAFQAANVAGSAKITDHLDKAEAFRKPLKIVPLGKKIAKVEKHTVIKKGKEVASFPDRVKAEQHILASASEAELQTIADRGGVFGKRAQTELQDRQRTEPGIKVKGTAEGLEKAGVRTPEVEAKLKDLEAKLKPMLDKFGLGDVGLNVVRAINNNAEGSFKGVDKLIQVAFDATNPIKTMRHEALHALKDLGFFTPQQWEALKREAKKTWVDKYLKGVAFNDTMSRFDAYTNMGLSDEAILEEAIADAFGSWEGGAKPPPGMMAALFKRLQQFFAALRQALTGAGFESADEIFGKIERGELKVGKETAGTETKMSLIRPAVPGETEISTQNPQGIKRTYDPITQMLSIDEAAVREAMKANPDMAKRTIQAIKAYGFIPAKTPNGKVLETFKQNIVNNLMFLYRSVPERIRQRSKLWYDGANKIATEMASQFNVSMEQVAGIMAAMSPQKDWFQNVSMAERALDILTKQGNMAWDDNMLKYARSYVEEATDRKEREKRQDAFEKIKAVADKNTKLQDMDIKEAAAFIRAYDEAYHSRNYRIVTPEGGFGDLVRNMDGKASTMMWSTYGPIEKTVSIFRDGSRQNISQQLGFEHKIRSFYNNIAAPNSDISHVTIDTHAVAAGLFEALAGTDPEVAQNFGGTGSSDVIGVGGTYGLIADAYREAAAKAGLKAREMQSITWEAVRGLFTEEMKSSIKPKVRAEWVKYKNGEQSFDETRQKVIEIAGGFNEPDWVGSGTGTSVADGGASYDKSFVPQGGVRLREAKELREKLTFNLSAVTNSIPGLRELYQRAMGKDKEAYTTLQKVAESSLTYLLSGTNARVNVEYAKGVYLSDREPSISVQVSFDESESPQVLAALANFAESYNQQQIHVRQPTIRKPGHEFPDGSYATVVYEIPIKKELSNVRISEIIEQSGLAGFTVTPDTLTAYWVKPEENNESSFDTFKQQVVQVNELVGARNSRPKQTIERLFVYGEGYGARIGYSQIKGQLLPKQSSDTRTPRIIAEYLTGEPVTTFKQKPLSQPQVKDQELLANVFDEMPTNDLKNPLVKRAYQALAKALKEQFAVLPIKIELVDSTVEPYANSTEMRQDVSRNNRFRVYKTTADTFGPPGSDFRGHPLLQDSGLTDINGEPMLYNDLLRAVHDYFAHNLSETEFGPRGEAAAWRNHMAITNDPLARWALTVETRAQNAWQNFRHGVQNLTLMERGFADQKAALPPVNFVLTGNKEIDQPMIDYIGTLSPEEKLGSLKPDSKLAKKVLAKMPDEKLSLRTYFPTAEEAENAAYKAAPPATPEFKRFFGASKVKEEGRPQVMYHASPNEFDIFRENKPIFVSPSAKEAEYYGKRHLGESTQNVKIYPLWVRAETPFDYENKNHLARLSMYFGDDEVLMEEIADGNWDAIESPEVQDAIIGLGHDSFYVNEGKEKNLAVFNANQVKSVTGNIGEFGENKNIKYSLPVVPADIDARVNETTQQREHKGFIDRILSVFAPESLADLRASFIHRYNQLGVYDRMLADKMGDKVLMADMSAEAAANMSDLSASVTYAAFGIGNRQGGIPVYKNGMTTVDTSTKGPLQILSPLAQFNDPKAYQHYQFWAGVKRGSRFMAETSATGVVSYREKNFEPADIEKAERLRKQYKDKGVDFNVIQKEMNTFNDGLVDYMIATGVLSKERAAEFKKHMDYIPFYRQLNGENTVGPKIFNSISGVKPPKKLKGSEAPLTDYLESIVQNTQAAINAGMKNMAAQRAVNVAMQLGKIAGAEKIDGVSSAPDSVTFLENGKAVSYRVADQLFINAVKSLNMVEIPFLGMFSAPSNLLRNLVTKDPGFMLANLARDSLSAWITSGSNMTPIAGTVANFAKALGGKDPSLHALFNAGILGGYEFSSGVIKSGEVLEKDLNKKYGSSGKAAPLKVFHGIWDALEKGTEASDAATRMAVYERVLAETGNETEALYRALEVMNFNRKGSSPVVRILTAAIPFLNARVQGLDVFYRTAMGRNVSANAEAMQKAFFVRGATLMALSAAYFLAVSDDDEWKKQEQETKDNYWIAPGIGKFPTPFEVGFLFKTVPERIMAYTLKDDTGQDFMASMQRGLLNTFAFNPIPQIAKPIIEYNANYNFFTGRPIVSQGMEGLEPQYQVGPNTTKTAEALGKALGIPPIKLDQLINSYTGTMGMYAMSAIDAALDTQSNSPHASKRFEQLPIAKRFMVDPEARGNITQFYELKKAVDAAVQTQNYLLKSAKPEEYIDFIDKNKGLLAVKPYVSNIEKSMKQTREMRKMIQGAEMSGDEKRDILTELGRKEDNLTANIQSVKKMISELQ